MWLDILFLFAIIDTVFSDTCYHYSYGIKYCSGYCSGFYGSQHCVYYDGPGLLNGGAIAGLVVGILVATAVVVIIALVCLKSHNRRVNGGVIGPAPLRTTTVAVTSSTQGANTTGYMQPTTTYPVYTASGPPQYNTTMYPPPPPYSAQFTQGYSAPAQPQYSSVFNQSNYKGT